MRWNPTRCQCPSLQGFLAGTLIVNLSSLVESDASGDWNDECDDGMDDGWSDGWKDWKTSFASKYPSISWKTRFLNGKYWNCSSQGLTDSR